MNFVIGNEKGGVGKSMLSINIAAGIVREGHTAVLVDTDTTATSRSWYEIRKTRELEEAFPVILVTDHPEAVMVGLATQYQNLVLDVGARDYRTIGKLAKIAGYWLAPTRVSQGDMESTVRLFNAIRKLPPEQGGRVPFHVLLNSTPTAWNSPEEQDAREFMAEMAPTMPILKHTLRDRRAWRDVGKSGYSIYELPRRDSGKAIDEFSAVFAEIMTTLPGQTKPARPTKQPASLHLAT